MVLTPSAELEARMREKPAELEARMREKPAELEARMREKPAELVQAARTILTATLGVEKLATFAVNLTTRRLALILNVAQAEIIMQELSVKKNLPEEKNLGELRVRMETKRETK
jgi:hypothetical protein